MSLALLYSRAQVGLAAVQVTVEVHLGSGLPSMSIVGLPETAVKESKDRVRSAVINAGYEFPAGRVTVNLAPADLPKEGGRFDLPIALGILAASRQLNGVEWEGYEFIGELLLSGGLRSVRGLLPASIACRAAGRALLVPVDGVEEAAIPSDAEVYGAASLPAVTAHLRGDRPLPLAEAGPPATPPRQRDLSDVRGQAAARRGLEIAAAGGHSLLMFGPPGTGKTLLASRLPGILPPMQEMESLESAAIASISAHGFTMDQWGVRPFRAPHHTASGVALVGGGSNPRPGEISLAHNGVLFLDELPEFDRRVLEVLREPLESGRIMISRAARQAEYPARFQLVSAMNPCPCGYHGDESGRCRCSPEQVARYRGRISGPLLDRIDLQVEVARLSLTALAQSPVGESSETVRARVVAARERQLNRCGVINAHLEGRLLEQQCAIDPQQQGLLERAMDQLGLSARAYHRILRVARTIADLATADTIQQAHLAEAIGYRRLDRAGTNPSASLPSASLRERRNSSIS